MQDNGGTGGGRADVTLAAQTFTVNVDFVNQPPQFTGGGDVNGTENQPLIGVGWATHIVAGPPNESNQTVAFNVTNDSPQLFTIQPTISPTGALTFWPAPYATGTANVTVALQDNGGTADGGQNTSATQTFSININYANQAPYFTLPNTAIDLP